MQKPRYRKFCKIELNGEYVNFGFNLKEVNLLQNECCNITTIFNCDILFKPWYKRIISYTKKKWWYYTHVSYEVEILTRKNRIPLFKLTIR